MNSFDDYLCSIARIYDNNDSVIGTGFLISSKYLLTCCHVIKDALDLHIDDLIQIPSKSINFDLPCSEFNQAFTAKVIFWNPCLKEYITNAQRGEDIACLEIQQSVSLLINPIKLTPLDSISEHQFKIYGFPETAGIKGMSAKGKIKQRIAEGWLELQPDSDRPITGGFSGSPVWDISTKRFVGMTVASNQDSDDEGKIVNVAFTISNDVLINYCLKFVNLYSIFPPQSVKLIELYQTIFNRIKPPDWYQQPNSILAILQQLNDMPPTNDNISPLEQFVVDLTVQTECPDSLKESLKNWGKTNIYSWQTSFLLAQEKQKQIKKEEQKYNQQVYFLLLVYPTSPKIPKYNILGKVIVENGQRLSDKIAIEEEKTLDLEIQKEGQLSIDDIQNKLESIIQDLILKAEDYLYNLEKKPKLVCFLPLNKLKPEFININNFSIIMPSDYEDEDEKIILGLEFQVIIRSYRRLNLFNKKYKNEDKWKRKWKKLQTKSRCDCCFCCDGELDYEDLNQIKATFDFRKPEGLTLSKHPSNKILKYIYDEGIPVCIWVRNNYQNDNIKRDFADILIVSIDDISTKIMEKHHEAIRLKKCFDEHIGHHLSLMLEDPFLLPTTINYS